MATFKADELNGEQLDWFILRDGGICLYWQQEILANDLSWLKSNNYKIISFEAEEWLGKDECESECRMHESLKAKLSFPDYYGKNLNALDECMLDDLAVPDLGGLALVLYHYDRFSNAINDLASNERGTAHTVLSIFARAVQHHMLFGRRLLILVQSDDPRIRFGPLGCVAARWNRREWLNKNRGL